MEMDDDDDSLADETHSATLKHYITTVLPGLFSTEEDYQGNLRGWLRVFDEFQQMYFHNRLLLRRFFAKLYPTVAETCIILPPPMSMATLLRMEQEEEEGEAGGKSQSRGKQRKKTTMGSAPSDAVKVHEYMYDIHLYIYLFLSHHVSTYP